MKLSEVQMTEAAKQWVGQVVDGKFRLGPFVGGNQLSAVFLTDYEAPGVRKFAIKLVAADSPEAAGLLARWKHAAKLSHPHLIRLLEMGRCNFNDTPILYVVMEYAEENLGLVVSRRPLGPMEARAILGPVVEALGYIHAQGFVHTRIKPANILADEDLLKISSDGLCRIGESSGSLGKPSAYDPPEASGGRISPAGDVWSLGMTLVEALTQRLPVWERTNQAEPALPSNLPPEFLDLARHCLRRDPQLRWSVADIAARLQPNTPAQPKQINPNPQMSLAMRRAIGAAVFVVLAVVAILAVPQFFRRNLRQQPAVSTAIEEPAILANAQPTIQPKITAATQSKPEKKLLTPEPTPPVAKSVQQPVPPAAARPIPQSAAKPVQSFGEKKPAASNPAPLPTPVQSTAPATSSESGIVRGKVLQQVLPDAPQKARATIQGKVRINIRVHVDESGNVTEATFDAPGPSQYFADRALKAAQLWKFAPAKTNGRNVPSEWLLRFEIDPAAINAYPTQTAP
jgi:TonB family protein